MLLLNIFGSTLIVLFLIISYFIINLIRKSNHKNCDNCSNKYCENKKYERENYE